MLSTIPPPSPREFFLFCPQEGLKHEADFMLCVTEKGQEEEEEEVFSP